MPSFSFSAAVSSSSIKGLSYSEDAKALAVVFHSGLSYMYTGVPKEVAIGLLGAESVGNYHATRIKKHFPYLKVGLQDQSEVALPTEVPPEQAPARKARKSRKQAQQSEGKSEQPS
jgi:hypothetical protein